MTTRSIPSSFKAICRTSNGRQILETLNTSTRGRILNGEAQVLELVADGVGQIPVLGGAGLGAGLENLGSGLVHVVARVGDQAGGNAWERQDQAWWHSPLKYADKCTTPTLFIHSDEDYRCWMADALQMFTALRMHGVPTRVCLFHGENHELSRSGKPKHRVRRLKEITNWFDHYLKHE